MFTNAHQMPVVAHFGAVFYARGPLSPATFESRRVTSPGCGLIRSFP
jgi:hypothetical protein